MPSPLWRTCRHNQWRRPAAGRQDLFVPAYPRCGGTNLRLATGFGIGIETAHRYLHLREAVDALEAPGCSPRFAEIGGDRSRFAGARALKSYVGSTPITRAYGTRRFGGRRPATPRPFACCIRNGHIRARALHDPSK